jgi:hypothetical protein
MMKLGFTIQAPQRIARCHHCRESIKPGEVSVVLTTETHGKLSRLYIHLKCYLNLVPEVLQLTNSTP